MMVLANVSDLFLISASLSMVGFLGAVLYYYLSKILNSASIGNDARKELAENALNIAAIFLLIPLLPLYDTIATSISKDIVTIRFPLPPSSLSGTTPSPASFSIFASSQIMDCMRTFMFPAAFIHGTFALVRSVKHELPTFAIGIGTDQELPGVIADNAVNMLVYFFVTYQLWVKILAFGAAFGPLFIAIGFPLRSFAPLRGAGGYLIALGISMYFILPLAYTYLFISYWQDPVCEVNAVSPTQYAYSSPLSSPYSLISIVLQILKSFGDFVVTLNNFLANVFIGLCLLPLVALGVALTTTSIGSSVLGSRLAEIGRGLIKLI